jgi:sugar lactone lactonase YvrE
LNPDFVLEVENQLGEAATWRGSDETLWWTDIEGRQLHRLIHPSGSLTTFSVPERLASIGFVSEDDDCLLCAFESGFGFFWPATERLRWIDRPLRNTNGVRLNDGRIDRQGRFWAGSAVEDRSAAPAEDAGVLYRLDSQLVLSEMETSLGISNGLAWSPDGSIMYFSDSLKREIWIYEFDPASGTPSRRRLFKKFAGGEHPDGACVDAQGNLWVAVWGAGRVECLTPDGQLRQTLIVPTPQPSCVCFGGRDLATLFVTSARVSLTDEQLRDYPLSGALLAYKGLAVGVPEPRFRGPRV